jgi:hypothetical protein
MAKVLSDNTANRLMIALDVVDNLPAPTRGQSRRRVRTKSKGGGGAERPYVVITSVTDAANYVGDVLTSPADPTVVKSAVTIKVKGALSNPFNIGYESFSDLVDDIYYLDGLLLN